MRQLTYVQLRLLKAYNGKPPVELDSVSGASSSFVYFRPYGLIECDPCCHEEIRALLLAWNAGYCDTPVYAKANYQDPMCQWYDMGEKFLKLPGTAYKSSCSKFISTLTADTLEDWEKAFFGAENLHVILD